MVDHAPAARFVHDHPLGRGRHLFVPQSRPRRGPLVHDQDDDRARWLLPPGTTGPDFNDEYGDVYSALYMLTAEGLSLADLKARAEDIRQRLLRVPDVNKVDIIGERPQKIFIEFSHAKLAMLGLTPQQIFDSVARQNAVVSGGSVDT